MAKSINIPSFSKVLLWFCLSVFISTAFLFINSRPIQASSGCETNSTPVSIIDQLNPKIGIDETIVLSASGSHDPDGDDLNYLWSINYLDIQQTGETFEFTPPNKGYFTVTLVAGDQCGNWDVTWTVVEVGFPKHCSISNSKPVPVIEPQFTTIIQGDTVHFDSRQSSDPDEDNLSFLWAVNQLDIQHAQPTFDFTPPEAGQYVVTLVVGDQCGAWGVDFTIINVEPGLTKLPDLTIDALEYFIANEDSPIEAQIPAIHVLTCNHSGVQMPYSTPVKYSEMFKMKITINGANRTFNIVPLGPENECESIYFALRELSPQLPGPGDYNVSVVIDSDNRVAESDETNNTISQVMHFDFVDVIK